MLNSDKYLEILKEYENLRDKSKFELELKKKEIYKKFPEIKDIDDKINLNSIKLARSAITLSKDEIKEFIANLEGYTNKLLARKNTILLENGYKEDYLKEKHHCSFCKDTGYIDNKKCKCFKQKIIDINYNMYELKESLTNENFEKFDFSFFLDKPYKDKKQTPYNNIRDIFNKSQEFVNNFDKKFENILFYGDAGSGKTFLCNCIAKELLDSGKTVIYNTAPKLFKILDNLKFNSNKDNTSSDKSILDFFKEIEEVDLLIIDDLGSEFITVFSSSELFNIIDSRISKRKPTIITTNLDFENISSQYSSRVFSRIYGNYSMLEVYGEDIRIFKKIKK